MKGKQKLPRGNLRGGAGNAHLCLFIKYETYNDYREIREHMHEPGGQYAFCFFAENAENQPGNGKGKDKQQIYRQVEPPADDRDMVKSEHERAEPVSKHTARVFFEGKESDPAEKIFLEQRIYKRNINSHDKQVVASDAYGFLERAGNLREIEEIPQNEKRGQDKRENGKPAKQRDGKMFL